MKSHTKKQLKKQGYTGYLRGEKFDGEWPNGGSMYGYGVYHCEDGEIDDYGDFSKSGRMSDREDAGDCIESANEKRFQRIRS